MRNQRLELVCADKPLRFEVGDEVEARTEDGWTKGKVLVQWDDADGGMVLGSPFILGRARIFHGTRVAHS